MNRESWLISVITALFAIASVLFPRITHADVLFLDQFNGTGELHAYNNAYELVPSFHSGTGTFGVFTDHVETTGYDPGYVYTAIPGDNVCASIDFNWTGKQDNGANGGWTDILLHSIPSVFGVAFQVRSDDPTHQRWTFYNAGPAGFIYESGPISFDLTQTHTLKACVSGSTVTGYLDGVYLTTVQDTLYSGGYVGFASQSPTYYLDNFRIETAPQCLPSDLSATVVIDGCNSGVSNTLFPTGCTISDLIAECAKGASKHGQFVSCVAHLTNDLKKAGTITGQQKGAIQSCAAQAAIP